MFDGSPHCSLKTVRAAFAEPPGHLEQTVAKIPGIEGGEGKLANPKELKPADRDELRKFLDQTFGSPAKPSVSPDDEVVQKMATDLGLDDANLAAGSKLYRRHCLQCHGLTGDGRGPVGPWLQPHPRDYRQGLFKFISSDPEADTPIGKLEQARKPRRDDLHRTLVVGVDGTSMPSFALLSDEELNNLISYIMHLSLRGEVEYVITNRAITGLENDVSTEAETLLKLLIKRWKFSSDNPINPKASAPPANKSQRLDSVRRGYDFFTSAKVGNCVSCHFDFGRQAQFRYDAWGSLARPRNLTEPVYRGGRRPIDLFYRVNGGINPCAMPGNKDEAQVWDMVNFVQALPYREMLPDDVREKVYPEHHGEEKKLAGR